MKYILTIKGKDVIFTEEELVDLKGQLGIKELTLGKEWPPVYPYPHWEITC